MGVIVAKEYTRGHPSPEYIEAVRLGRHYHETKKVFTGRHCFQQYPILRQLCLQHNTTSILDWGAGRGHQLTYRDIRLLNHKDDEEKHVYDSWQSALGVDEYVLYDPCVPQFEKLPPADRSFGGVFSVDVLNYIPQPDLGDWVLDTMFSYATQWVFSSFALYPGKKVLADGSLGHKTIGSMESWLALWNEAGKKRPSVEWHVRIEADVPPLTHRYFAGQGGTFEERERFFKVWKPDQLKTLTKKQREELEMIAKSQRSPIDPHAFRKNNQ